MRLYTKASPTTVGTFKKRLGFLFDYQLQLTQEEAALIQKYQYGDSTVGQFAEHAQGFVSVNQALVGKKGQLFEAIGPMSRFEDSLMEGCKQLAVNLRELRRIDSGGERAFEITAEGVELLAPASDRATPPPIP